MSAHPIHPPRLRTRTIARVGDEFRCTEEMVIVCSVEPSDRSGVNQTIRCISTVRLPADPIATPFLRHTLGQTVVPAVWEQWVAP